MLSLWIVAVIIAALFLHDRWKNRRVYQCAEKFPGPPVTPLLGNSLDFAGGNTNGLFDILVKFANQYERFYRVWNGGKLFVVLKDAKDIEVVLSSNTHIDKSDLYRFTRPWIGTGLLTSTGQKWKTHRKIITPTFHFKILDQFLEIFNRNGEIFCNKLEERVGRGPFNIHPYVQLAALDNISETAMGVNMKIQENSDSSYVRAVKEACLAITMRFFKVWLMFDVIFNLSKYATMQKNALKMLHQTTENCIKQRKAELAKKKEVEDNKEEESFYERKKLAFLDLLLQSADASKMSDQDIREEVDTFMFEGHDTVSSGISFTIYALATNPEVQEKAYQEQVEIFGNSDRLPTHKELTEMKYLEKVIKEAQRLWPSVPIISRELTEEMPLPDGYVVPIGTQVTLLLYSLHRDPKVWGPNPNDFDPEHFTQEAAIKRNPYAFVPFSAGARNCIGQKFAMMELKATLSKLLRRFNVLPSPYEKDKIQLAAELILISTTGYHVRLEPRKKC